MSSTPLTFVEEITLLALDDETGAPLELPAMAFSFAIAGAVLCDLALLNRIDTDPEQLTVLSAEPTGDPILDDALGAIAGATTPMKVSGWLNRLSEKSTAIEAAALDRLIARGVLRRVENKILWVFGRRRYPTIDNQERTEVRTRLSALILGDDLPDPRDAILISLLTASHLAYRIFSGPEYRKASERIATLARMDLVGRQVAASVDKVTQLLRGTLPVPM